MEEISFKEHVSAPNKVRAFRYIVVANFQTLLSDLIVTVLTTTIEYLTRERSQIAIEIS